MPSYDIATASFAVGAPRKWVDNVTSHHDVPGIQRHRRGSGREFSVDGIRSLSVIRALILELNLPIRKAVEVARTIQMGGEGEIVLCEGLRLRIDHMVLMRGVRQRLLEAAESVPRVRRGRRPAPEGQLRRSGTESGSALETREPGDP